MYAVSLHELTKTYGKEKTLAVDKVSFNVGKGEIFGLIGPDGAGKSSIFRMLTTLLLPDAGKAEVDGFDIVKDYKSIRNRVGYMPGKFSLYQDLTVEENLNFFATVFGTSISENYNLIKEIYVQLEPFKDRRAGKLSGGMKQKLALCCALIHKPSVLFLDEPTTGVDPVSRREFWEMLKRLKAQDITIIVSTPYMDEASLCDRIALIQGGKILSIDTPDKIIQTYKEKLYKVKSANMYALLQEVNKAENTLSCYTFGEYLHVSFKNETGNPTQDLQHLLQTSGHQNIEISPITPGIEDCFIQLLKN